MRSAADRFGPDVPGLVRHVPRVAGIPIVHAAEPGIRFAGPERPTAGYAAIPDDALVLEHAVGDSDVGDLQPLLQVGSYSTYYRDGNVVTVRIARLGDNSPAVLLRTVIAGSRYSVTYDSLPERPVLFRGAEMSAFALALAARRLGLMAHGCGVVLPGGAAALCLGVSGAGKSTLARMLHSLPDCRVLNDDRIVLTRSGGGVRAWSTPWPGSAGIVADGDAPLGVIALIGRGPVPRLTTLVARAALPRLLRTVLVPTWDGDAAEDGLAFLDETCSLLPIVELAYPLAEGVPGAVRDLLSRAAT